ncbi:MAG: contact-dependent growth inhibition system immunity protein [Acidobacteria bacterium]|nr:contact-dependent growth inhibition system immunity protein [Acidobacteriota bacterium]
MNPSYPRPSSGRPLPSGKRQAAASSYPALHALLRGYLHEDFAAEHGDAAGAARAYCRDASPAEIEKTVAEWRRFSAQTANWSVAELTHFFSSELGGAWQPVSRREIAAFFEILKAGGR